MLLRVYSIFNAEDIGYSKHRTQSFVTCIQVPNFNYSVIEEKEYLKLLNEAHSFEANLLAYKLIYFFGFKEDYVRRIFHALNSLCQFEL